MPLQFKMPLQLGMFLKKDWYVLESLLGKLVKRKRSFRELLNCFGGLAPLLIKTKVIRI